MHELRPREFAVTMNLESHDDPAGFRVLGWKPMAAYATLQFGHVWTEIYGPLVDGSRRGRRIVSAPGIVDGIAVDPCRTADARRDVYRTTIV